MDERRFDSLARSLAAGSNRRQVLKVLLGLSGLVAGATLAHDAEAARRGFPGPSFLNPPCAPVCDGTCCADPSACLDGRCFTQYPHCGIDGFYGLVANGGGVNACICGPGSSDPCATTGDCPAGQVCILQAQDVGFAGYCNEGCPG